MKNLIWPMLTMLVAAASGVMPAAAQEARLNLAVEHHTSNWRAGPVFHIYQDHYGYIWIGALGGMARFDGYRYDYFFHNDQAGLPRETVFAFAETPDGGFWAAGSNYLSRYGRAENRFEEAFFHPSKTHDKSFGLLVDEEGFLWADISGGLSRIGPHSMAEKQYRLHHPGSSGLEKALSAALISQKGGFWFGTFTGRLFRADSLAKDTFFLKEATFPSGHKPGKVNCLLEMESGELWAGCHRGIFIVAPGPEEARPFGWIDELNPVSSRAEAITGLCQGPDGEAWVATHNNLFIINPADSTYTQLHQDDCNPNALRETNIHTLMLGRDGTAWLGTNIGFTKVARIQSPFGFLRHNPANKNGIARGAVYAFAEEPDGTLWAGAVNGLYRLDEELKVTGRYLHHPSPFNVRSLLPAADGSIWVGTYQKGLGRLYPERQVFHAIDVAPPGSPGALATHLIYRVATRCRNGRIWFGRVNGVSTFDPETKAFRHYTLANEYKEIEQQQIFTITEDSDGGIWVGGTTKRLHHYLPEKDSFEAITSPSLRHNIFTIHEQEGTPFLWIGGQGDGLHQFDRKEKKFVRRLNMGDGLPSNVIYGILQDGHQNLWLSTSNGLAQFNLQDHSFRSFNELDGQPLRDFSSGAYLKSRDGRLFFGGEGIIFFHPDSITHPIRAFTPPLLITSIDILGKEEHWGKPPEQMEEAILQPGENFLSISFTCLDHTFPSAIKYRYFLQKEGQKEENWSLPLSQPYAHFHNLAPGAYTFRLRSTDSKGRWLGRERRLAIIARPYFWQTPLFFGLAILLLAAGIAGGVWGYMRNKANKQRRSLEMKAHQASFSALMSQLNPHFLFNALNSGNQFIAEKDVYSANKFLTRFAGLMRRYLENSRQLFISLQEEIETLELYLEMERLRFGDKFDYEITSAPHIDKASARIPSMLAFPFVENAIKHGLRHKEGPGLLSVSFTGTADMLCVEVKDDGIGRARAAAISRKSSFRQTSTGIANVMERIQLIKAMYGLQIKAEISDLHPDGQYDKGTRVVIHIPIPKDYSPDEDHRHNR